MVIPYFNVELYLEKVVLEIPDYIQDIILMDDASEDSTRKIIDF